MILFEKTVTARWSYKTSKRYKKLGYTFTSWGDEFQIKPTDLSPNSSVKVKGYCPSCNLEQTKRYEIWYRRGTTLCQIHSITNLKGKQFGRLKVVSLSEQRGNIFFWNCECVCGEISIVRGSNLREKGGGTYSCGNCRYEDIKGQKFNKLTAIKHIYGGKWECKCECGNVVYQHAYSLKNKAYSCGKGNCNTSHIFRRGKNSPTWNSTLSDEDRADRRHDPKYKQWAKDVKNRDSYICQSCKNSIGGNLVSHHLNSYASNPALRYEIDNGVTLCVLCHTSFHSWMGGNRIQCNEKDYIKWRAEDE